MKRRDFIKSAAPATVALGSGAAIMGGRATAQATAKARLSAPSDAPPSSRRAARCPPGRPT